MNISYYNLCTKSGVVVSSYKTLEKAKVALYSFGSKHYIHYVFSDVVRIIKGKVSGKLVKISVLTTDKRHYFKLNQDYENDFLEGDLVCKVRNILYRVQDGKTLINYPVVLSR